MEYVGIFLFGIVVTALVVAACFLIVFGIITEKQEREELEAQQAIDPTPGPELELS